jgi:hypothetical protein
MTTTMSFCSTSVGQMNAMRTQLRRRVLRSILNEVGSYSFAVAKKVQLEHVHRVVRTATDKAFTMTIKRFSERAMGNCGANRENCGGNGEAKVCAHRAWTWTCWPTIVGLHVGLHHVGLRTSLRISFTHHQVRS